MSTNFEMLKKQLDDAVGLIEKTNVDWESHIGLPESFGSLNDIQSLLDLCDKICKEYEVKKKPTIRIIHHLACSGGTLISKCISAMPNVYLLSEVHPFINRGTGLGTDISTLTKYAGIPNQRKLAEGLFKESIDKVYQHVNDLGGALVLRDHSHVDFNTNEEIPEKSRTLAILEEDYTVQSILTIRNPIDSYESLVKNGWVHFKPRTFDEYCSRLLQLINKFKKEEIFKYEDFVKQPKEQMQMITKALSLPYDDDFEDIFGIFKVTGDSGRSSDVISDRPRRELSATFENEIINSTNFQSIIDANYFKTQ
ncbi:hypothetical protein RGQ13_14385 [Thalassotalea psychrophila]|uniref:Sulfotransferase family protein n=1 Tax=Thalassotalea psychrophila TaxID=3065647 RepID=A0ABY9TR49_9GAMM|nr:hypothetical protein RGQ13_14385 [Colwelliaceae bacterium SQ149]